MTREEIKQKVIRLVAEHFKVHPELVSNETSLIHGTEQIRPDNMDIYEIAMELEDEFEISISDDEFNTWKTVRDIIDCVLQLA